MSEEMLTVVFVVGMVVFTVWAFWYLTRPG
jgi:hypothetical protein